MLADRCRMPIRAGAAKGVSERYKTMGEVLKAKRCSGKVSRPKDK